MTRLMLMTFFGKERWEEDVHPHESPKVMTIPLMVLAALSLLGGLLLLNDWIVDFLSPVVGTAPVEEPPLPAIVISLDRAPGRRDRRRASPGCSSAGATVPAHGADQGLGVHHAPAARSSTATRSTTPSSSGRASGSPRGLTTFDSHRGRRRSRSARPRPSAEPSGRLRLAQNGFVRSYALSLLAGAAIVLLALVVVNLG